MARKNQLAKSGDSGSISPQRLGCSDIRPRGQEACTLSIRGIPQPFPSGSADWFLGSTPLRKLDGTREVERGMLLVCMRLQ